MVPSNAIRKAVVQKLEANSTLMGLVTGIYDNVPEGTPVPYIRLGQVITLPQNTMGLKGHVTTLTIDIFTEDEQGVNEAVNIFNEVDSTLDQKPLALDTPFTHIYTHYQNHQEIEEEETDGITTHHIPADYDIFTTGG